MENPQRSLLATLQLLRGLDETELYEFEFGFPTFEMWEDCFQNPLNGSNYELIEGAHARLMHSEEKLVEFKKRLLFSGPHEFLSDVFTLINSWVEGAQSLSQWLDSSDGGMDDEEQQKLKAEKSLYEELLAEIGGECPFRGPNEDGEGSTKPAYHELDPSMRIALLSAISKWACLFNESILQALHDNPEVVDITRCEPIGWDKEGSAYFWFGEVAPYRVFKESYPEIWEDVEKVIVEKRPIPASTGETDALAKKAAKTSNSETSASVKLKNPVKSSSSSTSLKNAASKKTSNSGKPTSSDAKSSSITKSSSSASGVKRPRVRESSSDEDDGNARSTKGDRSQAKKLGSKTEKIVLESKKNGKVDDRVSKAGIESNGGGSKTGMTNRRPEQSKRSSDENESSTPKKKVVIEEEVRFTSSGRVIRMPPPVPQYTAQSSSSSTSPSKRAKVDDTVKKGTSGNSATGAKQTDSKRIIDSNGGKPTKSAASTAGNKAKTNGGKSSTSNSSSMSADKIKNSKSDKSKSSASFVSGGSKSAGTKEKARVEIQKPKFEVIKTIVKSRQKRAVVNKRDPEWPGVEAWECMCVDLAALEAFVERMVKAKENENLIKALKRVLKHADEIGKEMVEALEKGEKKKVQAIRKFHIKLAYGEFGGRRGNLAGSLDDGPIQLRRSGRERKPTEAFRTAQALASSENGGGNDSDDDDNDDDFDSDNNRADRSRRHRNVPQAMSQAQKAEEERLRILKLGATGSRRSRRLAAIGGDEGEQVERDSGNDEYNQSGSHERSMDVSDHDNGDDDEEHESRRPKSPGKLNNFERTVASDTSEHRESVDSLGKSEVISSGGLHHGHAASESLDNIEISGDTRQIVHASDYAFVETSKPAIVPHEPVAALEASDAKKDVLPSGGLLNGDVVSESYANMEISGDSRQVVLASDRIFVEVSSPAVALHDPAISSEAPEAQEQRVASNATSAAVLEVAHVPQARETFCDGLGAAAPAPERVSID